MELRVSRNDESTFDTFFRETEPKLRRALVARYGPESGREAAAEALAYAWEHWDRVGGMENPLGYLFRVGQSRSRAIRRWQVRREVAGVEQPATFEPMLAPALRTLSPRQRVAVLLVYGMAWTLKEVADLEGISVSSVETHLRRGLEKLRAELRVDSQEVRDAEP